MKQDGLSIIITAYNEEGNLSQAVHSAIRAITPILSPYEVLIIDDASTDKTAQVGRRIAKKNRFVRYMRRSDNGGLGQALLTGIEHSRLPYVTWFPGDNDTSGQLLQDLGNARHNADMIMAYMINPSTRPRMRRFLSWGFTLFLNTLFGFRLRYYNGCFLTKTTLVRSVRLSSPGHALIAELKIKLLCKGISYMEIPFRHIGRKTGTTTAFRFRNIIATLQSLWILIRDVRLKH